MRHAIIYVPGLGDHRSRSQRVAIWLWRIYGVRSEVLTMDWRQPDPFAGKLARLLARIDDLSEQGYRVSLVGVSAGASAVVNAFAQRQDRVSRVVCICGKLQHAETIGTSTYRRNPAFAESMQQLPESLLGIPDNARTRLLSIRPLADLSVPPADTIVPGAAERVIPTSGHVFSIAMGITVYSWLVVRFARGGGD